MIIEAWAQGRPLVATEAKGPATLVKDGETGLLVPIDDVPKLAAAIERILSEVELAEALVTQGRVAYEANFTETAVVCSYMEFFERITA